jgi:hypothetical protein
MKIIEKVCEVIIRQKLDFVKLLVKLFLFSIRFFKKLCDNLKKNTKL